MDVEWELDAFQVESRSHSPSPRYIPRSRSNSAMSISSAGSRSSTAGPASPEVTSVSGRIEPSKASNPRPWTKPVLAPSFIDKATTLENTEAERVRVANVLKSLGVPACGEMNPIQSKDYSTQLTQLEQEKKRRALLNAKAIFGTHDCRSPCSAPNMPLSTSNIAGGAAISDGLMAQSQIGNSPATGDYRRPILSCPTVLARDGSERSLKPLPLERHLAEVLGRKRLAEAQLHNFNASRHTHMNTTRDISPESEPERLGRSLEKAQHLFAIAQAEVKQQLGMNLADEEKELAEIGRTPETEQQFRDNIFIEAVKFELLTHEISQKKLIRERNTAEEVAHQQKIFKSTQTKMTGANAISMHRAREKEHLESSAERQTIARKEARDKRDEEADQLFHKSARATPPSPGKIQSNTLPCAPPFEPAENHPPPIHPWSGRPPFPIGSTPRSPHPIPVSRGVPPPLPPGVPVYPRPQVFCPPPPLNWPPMRARQSGIPSLPKPASSTVPQPDLASKSTGTAPVGLIVKTFNSIEGSTTTTITTNPEFEVDNGIEIITQTVRSGGTVTTYTNTTLTPFVGGGKNFKKWLSEGKGVKKAQTDDASGDESGTSRSSPRSFSLCDD